MATDRKCVRIPSAGGYEKLVVEAIGGEGYTYGANVTAENRSSCVRVKVKAFGVNYADVCIRWGIYKSAKEFVGWPICPGFEFSGTVEEVGDNVHDVKVGDSVFGVTLFGAYSECVLVPRQQIFLRPAQLSEADAAGFLAVMLTAYHAMHLLAHTRKGDTVLVHSAAGGVGSSLVQLGKVAGAKVVGVIGSSHKAEALQALGCDAIIDKSKEDLWKRAEEEAPKGFDAVFDANGVSTLQGSYDHLAAGGKLITYGFHSMLPRQGGVLSISHWAKMGIDYLRTPRFNPIEMTSDNKSVMAFNLSFMFDRTDLLQESMGYMLPLVEQGKLKVAKVTTYPMEDVAKAHKDIESGSTVGKLVLTTSCE